MNGVSCTSATACTAVGILIGYVGPILAPVAEAWNGTSWTIQNTPTPSGAGYPSQFNAVSCTSATACRAVGSYPNKSDVTQSTQLIERESESRRNSSASLQSEEPWTVEELAAATDTRAPMLYRLLRALAGRGVLAERNDGRL